jgi:thioredoxin 1
MAVKPGDVCPPLDSPKVETPAPVPSDIAKPQKKPTPPDTTKKAVAPPVKRETTAAKPEPSSNLPKPSALPRLWDFGSDNCIPCKMMMPILNDLAKEYAGKVDVRIINVYKEQALATQYRIQVIPTQIFMDAEGKQLSQHIGFFPRDSILAKFKQLGFEK